MAWARVSSSAVAPVPVGAVIPFAGISAPSDWMLCDGSAVSRTTYATLFNSITVTRTFTTTNGSAVVGSGDTTSLVAGMFVEGTGIPSGATISSIGSSTGFSLSANATATGSTTLRFYAFGVGDGSVTFNLPDFRGRSPLGSGTGTGSRINSSGPLSGSGLPTGGSALTARAVGQWGGQEEHTLTTANMPTHTHTQQSHGHSLSGQTFTGPNGSGYVYGSNGGSGLGTPGQFGVNNATAINNDTGGGGAHHNMTPFVVTHYIIRAV